MRPVTALAVADLLCRRYEHGKRDQAILLGRGRFAVALIWNKRQVNGGT